MDNSILKKRLMTYMSGSGKLKNVGDDVVMEVLRAWENWPGTSADLYRDLGLSKMQLVILIKKAKRMVSSGVVPVSDFKEVKIETSATGESTCRIEIAWDNGRLIRFGEVGQLIEFLKAVA